jgi:hypothetical protein
MKRSRVQGVTLVVAGLVLLVGVAVSANNAFAAKGGNHGGQGGGGETSPPIGTCSVTPDPATLGDAYTVNGSGFGSGEVLSVDVNDAHGMTILLTSTDDSGNFETGSYASWTGTYAVSVYDNNAGSLTYLTGCTFEVN